MANNNNCNNNNKKIIKRSGANYTKIRSGSSEGYYHVSAWKSSKNGLITASCFPLCSKDQTPKIYSSDKNDFITYVVKLKQGINIQTYFSLMNLKTQKIVIKELGFVISPNGRGFTKSGKKVTGYFGKLYKD